MKAGCGKTARPVCAADGGQRHQRASSDPTPVKAVKAAGGKGLCSMTATETFRTT